MSTIQKIKQLVKESSLSRIWRKTQKHVCGAITGFRKEYSKSQIKQNNREIVAYLRQKGYSITSIDGNYIEDFGSDTAKEVSEPSFWVCNQNVEGDDGGQLEKDLRRLGQLYDQDSVLIVPVGGKNAYLVGTSKRDHAWPSFGQKAVVGSGKFGKVSGAFLSRIKGREFAFEEIKAPGTINGLRGELMLAEEVEKKISKIHLDSES